jgi:hypothetical protein
MKHEKIIKDERGTVIIYITLVSFGVSSDTNGNKYRYDVIVHHIAPRKRNPEYSDNIATTAEILEAKLELWDKIKPC